MPGVKRDRLRAAPYARLSSFRGDGPARSTERQLEVCHKLIANRGWEALPPFVDQNVSGFNGDQLAVDSDYVRLMAAITAGQVDVVVVDDSTRLGRHNENGAAFRGLCRRHGVRIATDKSGDIDPDDPNDEFMATIHTASAQLSSAMSGRKVRDAQARNAVDGVWRGGAHPPYGYRHDPDAPGRLAVDEAEAAVVRRVAAAVLNDVPMGTLARALDAEGIHGRTGARLRGGEILRWATNPAVVARICHGGESYDARWPSILDDVTYERVTAVAAGRRLGNRGAGRPASHPLGGGIARCGRCGAGLVIARQKGRAEQLRCPNQGGCGRLSVKLDLVEARVVELLVEEQQRTVERVAARGGLEPVDEFVTAQAEIERIRTVLASYHRMALAPGGMDPVTLRDLDAEARRQIEVQEQLMAAAAPAPLPEAAALGDITEVWNDRRTTLAEMRRIVRALAQQVIIAPAGTSRRWDPLRVTIVPV